MISKFIKCFSGFALFLLLFCCSATGGDGNGNGKEDRLPVPSPAFTNYWYAGKAELNHYELAQARYGEIHPGDAVLIFVTEDFLQNTQVKLEHDTPSEPVENVLKLNFYRHFFTGIYPYSLLTSVFMPVAAPDGHARKVSTSSQEWCGHTYMQFNHRNHRYQGVSHSYFQDEADRDFQLKEGLLEDEIWVKIRLNPAGLPSGRIELVPGSQYLRLRHQPPAYHEALATLTDRSDPDFPGRALKAYRIEYRDIHRILEIVFEADFPHAILRWEEKVPRGWANKIETEADWLTTRARRTHVLMTDYWAKHSVADSTYRRGFGF